MHLDEWERDERGARISKTSTPDELRTYLVCAGFAQVELRRWGLWVVAWGAKPLG